MATDTALRPPLVPPPVGEPDFPKLRRRPETTPPKPQEVEVPAKLQALHAKAAEQALEGLKVGLRKMTIVLPQGVGDGRVGSRILSEVWRARRGKQVFRALALLPPALFEQMQAEYRVCAGNGLWVTAVEPGFEGTDKVATALSTCRALLCIGTYADARSYGMAMRRMRCNTVDLLIIEMASVALCGDAAANDAVFKWKECHKLKAINSVFISSRSLEANPVRGLQTATMVVPGTPPYRVVSRRGGPCGPEVFTCSGLQAREQGLAVPVRLAPLHLDGNATPRELVLELLRLHKKLGISQVEVAPTPGAAATAVATALDTALRGGSRGACGAVPAGKATAEAGATALLISGAGVNLTDSVQAIGRLALLGGSQEQQAVHLVVLGSQGPAAAAGWRALAEHDEKLRAALQQARVDTGFLGRELTWSDLPSELQDAVANAGGQPEDHQDHVAQMVNDVIKTGDEWDVWYGRLLAYHRQHPNETSVPISASVHGHDLGGWVARQFLEWRWGDLSRDKCHRLTDRGITLSEEKDRFFAEGLEQFDKFMEEQGEPADERDPFVPQGYFTESGFALGSWSVAMRAAWRKGRLSVEQQYLLDAVGFAPVAHPEDVEARIQTRKIERQIRRTQTLALRAREQTFRSMVLKYQPNSYRKITTEACWHFLAGYRDWYLMPPKPPDGI